jgi:hypothetical protein
MKTATDVQVAKKILDEMDSSSNQEKASKIVSVIGKRIRQRHRDRDAEKAKVA